MAHTPRSPMLGCRGAFKERVAAMPNPGTIGMSALVPTMTSVPAH
jgi:hypothetical protein